MKTTNCPHVLVSEKNHDETPSEPTIQPSQDSDDQCASSGDHTTGCPSSPTSDDSEFMDGGYGPEDVISEYIFENSNAVSAIFHSNDVSQLYDGMPVLGLADLLHLRKPAVCVDSDGVGNLVHQPIPSSIVDWRTVYGRLCDNIIHHMADPQVKFPDGTCIPQRLYCQGSAVPGDATGDMIMFATFDGECFPAALALAGKCSLLVLENVVLSIGEYQTIDLRIEWPGYDGWGVQIRTMGDQEKPRGITLGGLVKEIAKQLKNFIESVEDVAIDPAYAQYKVGPGGIETRHIHIASLEQVSPSSWQPRFIYTK